MLDTDNRVMLDGCATSFVVNPTMPTAKRYAAWLIDYRIAGQITAAEMLAGFGEIVNKLPAGCATRRETREQPAIIVALRISPAGAGALADCADIGFEGLEGVTEQAVLDVAGAIVALREAGSKPG